MNRRKIIKWIKDQPVLSEIEKVRRELKKNWKICYKCNSTYGNCYTRCSNCGSEKLDIIGKTILISRLDELELEELKLRKHELEKLGSDKPDV